MGSRRSPGPSPCACAAISRSRPWTGRRSQTTCRRRCTRYTSVSCAVRAATACSGPDRTTSACSARFGRVFPRFLERAGLLFIERGHRRAELGGDLELRVESAAHRNKLLVLQAFSTLQRRLHPVEGAVQAGAVEIE